MAVAIQRLVSAMYGSGMEFYLASGGAPTAGGVTPVEDISWMPAGRYRRFDLFRSGVALVAESARFVRWLSQIRCDVVHAHHRRLGCLANMLRPIHGASVLYTAHIVHSKSRIFSALCPPTVTGVSPSVMDYLRAHTNARDQYLAFNPYPFAVSDPLPRRIDGEICSRAISVGRLEPVKGHVHLIDAWRILSNQGVTATLDIYGEGHLKADLLAKVKADGLEGLVRFPGYCANVPERIRTSLFNVLTSKEEGFPNVVVESAAESVASLLTDVDGSRDTVPPDVVMPNKLSFGDVPALAETLARWFASPGEVVNEGRKFHTFIRERVSFDATRARFMEIYAAAARRMPAYGGIAQVQGVERERANIAG